jgi:signal transduction histidine kinase
VTPASRLLASLARLGVALVALSAAISVWSIVHGSGAFTTIAGRSESSAPLFVSAGVGLIAAGLITGRRQFVGSLSVVAGFVWFAPAWEGWEGGPAPIRTVGMIAARLVFPTLMHLVVAAAVPTTTRRMASLAVGSTFGFVGLGAVTLALFRDPYLDPHCWTDCTTGLFVISNRPWLANTVMTASLWVTVIAAAALIAICLSCWSVPGARRRHGIVLVGGVLLGVSTAARSLIILRRGFEDPNAGSLAIVFVAECVAALLIAGGLLWSPLYSRRVRRAVAAVVATLDETPTIGSLDSALAQATRDPNLTVSYWLPAIGRYCDASGHSVGQPVTGGRTVATPVVRNGQPIAVISHTSDAAELERILGPDLRLALDNERLRAEVLTQINDLTDSRQRIVEAGDERRRELERNLHDGAQQSLLGLSYDLRRARAAAETSGDNDLIALLDSASIEVAQAFAELRDLAHGIYPAVLSQAGIGPAVASLAETAPISVDVHCGVTDRLPAPVETAAYAVVADGIRRASQSGATSATVTIARGDEHVVVDVTPDRAVAVADMIHLADRVGAIGGTLLAEPSGIRAEIPCVS